MAPDRKGALAAPGRSGLERLWVLIATAFVDTLGAFLILALLPFYAERFGASPTEVGLLVAAFALAQTLTAPLWGRASDRVGRRPVILFGLALAASSYLIFALADSLWLLLLSRLAQGVGGGTVSVVFAYVTDAVPAARRAQGIGWVTAGTSLAAMIGPPLGSVAAQLHPSAPGLLTGALCLAALLLAWRRLPEPGGERELRGARRGSLRRSLWSVLVDPRRPVNALIWIYAAGMLAFTAMTAVAALYLERRFGVTERTIWVFFSFIAGLSIAVRVVILGRLVERFGEARVLRWGALFLGVGLLVLPLPETVPGLALAVLLIPVGTSLLFPCTTALVSRHAPSSQEMGQVLGVQQAFGGVSKVVGPLWAGIVFEHVGAGTPFWIAGLVVIGAWLGSIRLSLGTGETPEAGAPSGGRMGSSRV